MNAEINWKRFSAHFKEAMERNRHSVRALARLWECSPTTISNLRRGKPASSEVFLTACLYSNQMPLAYWSSTK